MKVKLEEIIQEIESQGDTFRSFLNKETGEMESISDEEFEAAENDSPLENYPSWQQGTIKKLLKFYTMGTGLIYRVNLTSMSMR